MLTTNVESSLGAAMKKRVEAAGNKKAAPKVEESRMPLPSSGAKSESTKSVRQARALRALAEGSSSSSSGISVVFQNEDINYVPEGGQVKIGYQVFPAGVVVSAELKAKDDGGLAVFEDDSTSTDISGEGELTIKGERLSKSVKDVVLKALSTERKLSVITVDIQQSQLRLQNGKWLPEKGSANNLLGSFNGEKLKLRVQFKPEEYKDEMAAGFIKWKAPDGTKIPDDTIEYSFELKQEGVH